jgi:hypothetical protein
MVASISDLDCRLQQLALEAQKYLPCSPQRQSVLNRLVTLILSSNRLSNPQRQSFFITEDIYNEAIQRTLLDVCQKIDNYRSKYPVMAWVNYILNCHFKAVVNEYSRKGLTYIPKNRNKQDQSAVLFVEVPSVEDLDLFLLRSNILDDDRREEARMLQKFLEEDPENLLRTTHIRGFPKITVQFLAWEKYIEDRPWDDLSEELGISTQTLCSFLNRNLCKFKLYFDRHLKS